MKVTRSCPPTLCYLTDYTTYGILQARILEWVAFPFPSPGDLPKPGIEPRSPALQENNFTSSHIFQGAVSHPPNCCLWLVCSPFQPIPAGMLGLLSFPAPNQPITDFNQIRPKARNGSCLGWSSFTLSIWAGGRPRRKTFTAPRRCQQSPFSPRSKWQRQLWRLRKLWRFRRKAMRQNLSPKILNILQIYNN